MRLGLTVILPLLLLLLGVGASAQSMGSYGPRRGSASLRGEGYSINITYVAEPLVEGEDTEVLVAYWFKADGSIVSEAYLRSPAPLKPLMLSPKPSSIDLRLGIPFSSRMLNFTLRAPEGSMGKEYNVSLLLYLDVMYGNGSYVRRNISMDLGLWVLSPEGSVPQPLVLGVALSLALVIAAPMAAYLRYADRRKAFTSALIISALLSAGLGLVMARGLGGSCVSTGTQYVLRYQWASNATSNAGAGTMYIWGYGGNSSSMLFPGVSSRVLGMTISAGCPQPYCIDEGQANLRIGGAVLTRRGEISYYYHNALRKAVLYSGGRGEAIYDHCGRLLRMIVWDGSHLYYSSLNASLGYDPPIAPGYYAELLLAPPLVSIALSTVLAWRSGKDGRHGSRDSG